MHNVYILRRVMMANVGEVKKELTASGFLRFERELVVINPLLRMIICIY